MTKHMTMQTPPIVSRQEWDAAREKMLVKEKATLRAKDALAAGESVERIVQRLK